MCGIAAVYGPHVAGETERMLGRLVHRGPDDEGEVHVDGAWLGHRRLSIVDVDGGRQPFANAAGDVWLVGNGEVYNHEQVRATLAPAPFQTRSDNEVALHLLDERGATGTCASHRRWPRSRRTGCPSWMPSRPAATGRRRAA